MQVIFTPFAESNMDDLYEYIASNSSQNIADNYISRIIEFCKQLKTFPLRGSQRDDVFVGLRTIGFEKRITTAFCVTDNAVLIEGIFYGGQNFEAILGGEG